LPFMFDNVIRHVKIELFGNFPCDNAYTLRCKQSETVDKMIKNIKMNKNK